MIIESKYDIGEIVYLKTDKEQSERIITAIMWTEGIRYELKSGIVSNWHYEFEITVEKNVLITTTN